MSERPLVSFLLIAYNQERFIREAVAGALCQTYSPLEIILSDDCSSDRTFATIQAMADAYRGPHKVILNRNPSNLGFVPHLWRASELAAGSLLILSAGDDVSDAERSRVIVAAWERSGFKTVSIYSAAVAIDAHGRPIDTGYDFGGKAPGHCESVEEVIAKDNCAVLGATQAVVKELFCGFPQIYKGIYREDNILPFRALLRDGILFVPEALVLYRHHSANLVSTVSPPGGATPSRRREALARDYTDKYFTRLQWIRDATAGGVEKVSAQDLQCLKKLMAIRKYQYLIATSSPLVGLFYILVILVRCRQLRGFNVMLYKYLGKTLNQLLPNRRVAQPPTRPHVSE